MIFLTFTGRLLKFAAQLVFSPNNLIKTGMHKEQEQEEDGEFSKMRRKMTMACNEHTPKMKTRTV